MYNMNNLGPDFNERKPENLTCATIIDFKSDLKKQKWFMYSWFDSDPDTVPVESAEEAKDSGDGKVTQHHQRPFFITSVETWI